MQPLRPWPRFKPLGAPWPPAAPKGGCDAPCSALKAAFKQELARNPLGRLQLLKPRLGSGPPPFPAATCGPAAAGPAQRSSQSRNKPNVCQGRGWAERSRLPLPAGLGGYLGAVRTAPASAAWPPAAAPTWRPQAPPSGCRLLAVRMRLPGRCHGHRRSPGPAVPRAPSVAV